MRDGEAEQIAEEARDLVRRAAGDVAGLTVAAQVRQAARHLGLPADHWRLRECWYGRGASPAALDDLRRRFVAWQREEQVRAAEESRSITVGTAHHETLAQRLDAIQAGLAELVRQVNDLAADVTGGAL